MVGSQRKADSQRTSATVLERMGGMPKHVVYAGKKASTRAERKARVSAKGRSVRRGQRASEASG